MEVLDAQGEFLRWAPLTLEGLCGHPCSDGKLCNNNAGDCRAHQRSELARMAREDEQAALVERGLCGHWGAESLARYTVWKCVKNFLIFIVIPVFGSLALETKCKTSASIFLQLIVIY